MQLGKFIHLSCQATWQSLEDPGDSAVVWLMKKYEITSLLDSLLESLYT